MKARKQSVQQIREIIFRELQWGRADEGAETLLGTVGGAWAALLQWGRADEGAETITAGELGGCNVAGFNGAAPMKARKPAQGTATRRKGNGFNGAAPMKARKRKAPGGAAIGVGNASMGPRR